MLQNVNLIAVLVAAVASMAIGAAWYSTLAKPWMAAVGFDEETVKKGDNPIIYVIAVICHFIMAYVLTGVIYHASPGGEMTIYTGLLSAFLIWAGFVVTTMIVNHRFQMKSWMLTIIDAGHYLLVMLAQGAILGWFGL